MTREEMIERVNAAMTDPEGLLSWMDRNSKRRFWPGVSDDCPIYYYLRESVGEQVYKVFHPVATCDTEYGGRYEVPLPPWATEVQEEVWGRNRYSGDVLAQELRDMLKERYGHGA